MLPNFIVLGAPRCGTRWLSQCLAEHPQIAVPSEEVYFFTQRRVVHSFYEKGLDWYSAKFEDISIPGITTFGDITPVYLFDEDTPGLISEHIPDVKLICCVRDQTDRAYSWYRFFLKINNDLVHTNYSFRKFLTYSNEVYGREGFYLEHINRYLSYFPRNSIHVMNYDDVISAPQKTIEDVYAFLDVDKSYIPNSLTKKVNIVNPKLVRSDHLNRFVGYLGKYKSLKLVSALIDNLNILQFNPEKLPVRHQCDPEMRQRMSQLYRGHNEELGAFLGQNLSHWNRCD